MIVCSVCPQHRIQGFFDDAWQTMQVSEGQTLRKLARRDVMMRPRKQAGYEFDGGQSTGQGTQSCSEWDRERNAHRERFQTVDKLLRDARQDHLDLQEKMGRRENQESRERTENRE